MYKLSLKKQILQEVKLLFILLGIELVPMCLDSAPSYDWNGGTDTGLELQIMVKPSRTLPSQTTSSDEQDSSILYNGQGQLSEVKDEDGPPRK